MELMVNHFKKAIRQGQPQLGLWSTLTNPISTELIACCGYDWIMLDTEHSPADMGHIVAQLQAVGAAQAVLGKPVSALVRPACNDVVLIKRFLDMGAQTLLIPSVDTLEEAQQAVQAVRYPPLGIRGMGGPATRAARYGQLKGYVKCCEDEICLVIQAETQTALENLEAMTCLEGVDGVFIGPADLSASMGYPGEPFHPQVQAAIEDAIKRIKACGKAPGILMADLKYARRYMDLGAVFVALGMDALVLTNGAMRILQDFEALSHPHGS
ncbi:aldolase/citrate lyase family protein [Saezia sanguinis]|uniref:aldolase/citrate lyase family protein n=1 Tax=Saezia sanguinis TaxID=1965230 RepID=UPI003068BA4D